jgi:hypothetical protein
VLLLSEPVDVWLTFVAPGVAIAISVVTVVAAVIAAFRTKVH